METAVADRIHGMLQRASAWGRRGWLVMMRARRIVAVQLLDEPASEKPSPGEQAGPVHDEEATERELSGVCVAVGGLSTAGAPPTDTPGRLGDQEKHAVATKANLSGGGRHDIGGQVGHAGGWECAVEWLLQCPDERGVFREIMSFL